MNKTLIVVSILAVISGSLVFAAGTSLDKKECSITCYEKTPACYVTKDSSGCLVISNEKPKCSKGSCVCKLNSCETKTEY